MKEADIQNAMVLRYGCFFQDKCIMDMWIGSENKTLRTKMFHNWIYNRFVALNYSGYGKTATKMPCAAISLHKGQCPRGGCVVFHLGRTCLLWARFWWSKVFLWGRPELLKSESERLPRSFARVCTLLVESHCAQRFTVGLISILTQSKTTRMTQRMLQHRISSQRWTVPDGYDYGNLCHFLGYFWQSEEWEHNLE